MHFNSNEAVHQLVKYGQGQNSLIECYHRINGPPLVHIDANNVSDDISVDENTAAKIKKVDDCDRQA
ncbi:unnamed protein product [Allacma fusca]|uniref:Uncharacterized protein n=1 Tax=Allacma fusca TaxID=39272 RepID=A0A8J2PMB7_9HEXA|nr:unnamed protein product [Allacma fusca]